MKKEITVSANQFIARLVAINEVRRKEEKSREDEDTIHVDGVGRLITATYEQLRNAAEYGEESLLLQQAIRRYYHRLFTYHNEQTIESSAEDLVFELTLAGYLKNDSVNVELLATIRQKTIDFYNTYLKLSEVPSASRQAWTIDVLAAEVEGLFFKHDKSQALAQFAFEYFLGKLKLSDHPTGPDNNNEIPAFIAVNRAIMKANDALIRMTILQRYQITPIELTRFASMNKNIDEFFESDFTEKLTRYVNKNGAPFRIIKRMIKNNEDFSKLAQDEKRFPIVVKDEIKKEYSRIDSRLWRGIKRSVVFLIITKFLLGLVIEVPYDLIIHEGILWSPLIINFLLPPVYMILLSLTLKTPGEHNTKALIKKINELFFGKKAGKMTLSRQKLANTKTFGFMFNAIYAVSFLAVFGLVSWLLVAFGGFDWVHLLIFFVFISAASFLGFRLSNMIREIETSNGDQNGITSIRDIIYMPFVVVGRWMSEKYSKVNVMTIILDNLIEMPLKSILRFVRQWNSFIDSKKDQL